nr:formin-like protein 5 [Aegilops tauschii subsp. strangulata]
MAQLASRPPGQPTAHSTLSVLQGHSPRPQTLNHPTIPLAPPTPTRSGSGIQPDDRAQRHPTSAPVLDAAPPHHQTSLSSLLPRTALARGLCLADIGAPRRHDSVAARRLRPPPRPHCPVPCKPLVRPSPSFSFAALPPRPPMLCSGRDPTPRALRPRAHRGRAAPWPRAAPSGRARRSAPTHRATALFPPLHRALPRHGSHSSRPAA